jgi:hypothetical protein
MVTGGTTSISIKTEIHLYGVNGVPLRVLCVLVHIFVKALLIIC